MSIKQKFESIDQSQLSENQKEILGKIKTATKDFTITDQKALDKVDGALDNIITKLKATNPQAIKGEAKKREPRAKKEVVKKEPKSETKKPKEAKKEAGGKRTIFSIAKEIRKADENWEDAKARAKKVMETEKKDTTKKMKSETDKLLAFIKRRKELEGLSGTSVKKDSKIEALPKGRRISKKGWKNQYGESEGGRVYYENRDNRTDRLAPSFDDKIYLADGGYAGGGYVVIAKSEKGGGFVMSKPSTKAKAEKLKSLLPKIDGETNEVMTIDKASKLSGLVGKEYLKYAYGGGVEEIYFFQCKNKEIRDDFFEDLQSYMPDHYKIKMGDLGIQLNASPNDEENLQQMANSTDGVFLIVEKYANGGTIIGTPETPLGRDLGISYTGLVGETGAMSSGEMFMDGGSTGLPAGAEQQFVNHYLNEGASVGVFEQGGSLVDGYLTDPNFGDFQAGIYAEGGSLGNHGLKQGDQIIKTMSGGVQKVKTRTGDIVYVNLANGYRGAEPPLPFDKGGRTTERRFVNHGQDYEVRYAKDKPKRRGYGYADGGTIIGTPETPLGRDLGISYTGLVGETGAMSSGEMFADGGTIDAFQMRTVRGVDNKPTEVLTDEQKVQFAKGGSIKNEDIKVGEEFWLSNGDVIEIVRLFKENIDEDWVEYKRNGDKKENSVKELRLFINRLSGKKQKSFRERRNQYLENLGQEESKVWDKIGAESGSEIRNNEKMLRAYAEGVQEMLQKNEVGRGSFDQEDYDFYTDENWHLFNEFLVWNSYYEPEMTKTEKAWREKNYADPKYRNYVSNPKIISLSGGSKSKSTNYIPKGKIATITIVKDGKEMVFLPSQVLNGVNLYKGGGKIKNDYVYMAKRYVKEVHYDNGKDLKVVKPSNGYWVKKSALKSFKQKFEGGGKTNFKEKATAIAKNFEGKKVKPKYQKEYGKTYDKAEAKEVGNKIAGSQKAKYDSKMSGGKVGKIKVGDFLKKKGSNLKVKVIEVGNDWRSGYDTITIYNDVTNDKTTLVDWSDYEKTNFATGGTTKRGGAMVLAKQIRKEGESWASALKRANEQMRKK
jgi:hypothetical protein